MRITPIASRLLVLSTAIGITIGITSLAPQLTAVQAAQAGTGSKAANVALVSADAADQTGLKKGATAIERNNPASENTGSTQRLALSKLEGCKSQFKLADLHGDGVLDAGEIAHYNLSIRSAEQPVLAEGDRFNEAGFIAECSSISAHE